MSVFISLGQNCDLGINKENRLVVQRDFVGKTIERIDLGPATKKRIEELQSYLERLKIHCE